MHFLSSLRIAYRVQFIAIVAMLGCVALCWFALQANERILRDGIRIKTQQHVDIAISVLQHYSDRAASGELSEDDAKRMAIDTIKHLRYAGKEYFWIHDDQVKMIMHPFKPELDGTDISQVKDPNGKTLFIEMTNAVKSHGDGFVEYMWPKPGLKDPLPKVSYVKGFASWGWIVGSGVYVDMIDAAVNEQIKEFGAVVAGLLFVIVVVSYVLARSVVKPILGLRDVLREISVGNLNVEIPALNHRDEIGEMANVVDSLRMQSIQLKKAESEKEALQGQAEAEKKRHAFDMLTSFNNAFGNIVEQLFTVTSNARTQVQALAGATKHTQQSTQLIATSTDDAADNVARVAVASEELSGAILEISRSVQHTTVVVQQAGSIADKVNDSVARLMEQTRKINQVTEFINGVAGEISLLALNATIESARAGDAGKGFAVVANEVKNLATQTTQASEEIAQQIQDIQQVSYETEAHIRSIVETTHQINGIITAIASAVEEQSAATNIIRRNISQSTSAVEQVSKNIAVVGANANDSASASDQVLVMIQTLNDNCEDLRSRVADFMRQLVV